MISLAKKRRKKLQELLLSHGIGACLLFHYSDLSYFTSSHLGNFLYLPSKGEPLLFTRKALEKTRSYNMDIKVIPYHSYKDIAKDLSPLLTGKTLGVPFSRVDFATLSFFCNFFSLSPSQIIDIEPLINKITLIKEKEEIEALKRANDDIVDIFNSFHSNFFLGKTEAEISSTLYTELRKRGFIGDYFFRRPLPFTAVEVLTRDSITSSSNADVTYSGKGLSPLFASGSGDNIIKENIPFVIDIMHNKEGMHADVTRTLVIGTPSDRLQKRFADLLDIQKKLVEACKVGTPISNVYDKTLEHVKKLGYKDHFMGLSEERVPFIGHNIGAWVDEYPAFSAKTKEILQIGMTFALEPKFYFEDFDSPGLESNYVQTKEGAVCLTPLSSNLIVL